jgi:hypothetical protein
LNRIILMVLWRSQLRINSNPGKVTSAAAPAPEGRQLIAQSLP